MLTKSQAWAPRIRRDSARFLCRCSAERSLWQSGPCEHGRLGPDHCNAALSDTARGVARGRLAPPHRVVREFCGPEAPRSSSGIGRDTRPGFPFRWGRSGRAAARTELECDPARATGALAAIAEDHRARDARLALCHVDAVGTGPHLLLQR